MTFDDAVLVKWFARHARARLRRGDLEGALDALDQINMMIGCESAERTLSGAVRAVAAAVERLQAVVRREMARQTLH
jgi:hypothetical protein